MKHAHKKLEAFDLSVITFFRKHGSMFGRIALFLIFFWFGILKVFLLSPAGPLVTDLLDSTFLKFMEPNLFMQLFGLFEVAIGILVLIPKLERITFIILLLHLVTTVMPLWILPDITWDQAFVPSLIGQYIMKNIALLALGVILFAHLKPMTETHRVLAEEEN